MLNACTKTSSESKSLIAVDLPDMPLAGSQVALELQSLCVDDKLCKNINDFLNKLYKFRLQYLIYKEELAK